MSLFKINALTNHWQVNNGSGTAALFWNRITSGSYSANDQLRLAQKPQSVGGLFGMIDLGYQGNAALARDNDSVTFAKNDTFRVNIRNVEYVSADVGFTAHLHQLGTSSFTTNGSLASIEANVGNHNIVFENAYRDSDAFLGHGWDAVSLATNPDIVAQGQDTYWMVKRIGDNSVEAYALFTGNIVHLVDGAISQYATDTRGNYGEIELLNYNDRNNAPVTQKLGVGDLPNNGSRGGFENIDLSDQAQDNYTDSLLAASFGSINFTSKNVFVGAAVIEDWFDDEAADADEVENQQSAALRWSTNSVADVDHNHDLVVGEQTDAIDGHLRVYVRDEDSRAYNRFNEVYLGTSTSESISRNGASTASNGLTLATEHVALYGFGGNDVITAGDGNDYVFGGASTFTTIPVSPDSGIPGNILTGGDGDDHFGVGNIDSGAEADAIMSTNFTSRLSGTAPTDSERSGLLSQLNIVSSSVVRTADTADLATRVATDRITDWTAGSDFLRVLGNGTAIIQGLGTADGAGVGVHVVDPIGSDAERIDLSGSQVVNNGKIVARGLGGVDTLIGSTGNDWLYGNADGNQYNLSQGGNDRIYIDQFDGSRSKHYVDGFTNSGTSANADLVMLNKRVIDSFYSAASGRTALTANAQGEYVQAQAYDSGLNFLHDPYYNPSIAAPNSTHTSSDGGAYWDGSANGGSDQTTSYVGLGMSVAGRALFAVPFVGPIIGAALIATGTLLGGVGFYPRTTKPHLNATFNGNVGAYLNVLTENPNAQSGSMVEPNTTVGNADATVRFLDFFQGNNAGDGYIPVVEFTAHSGQGIYGYFALHSDDETFVFLVASRDNLVENSEAILVAQINGRLTAADFGIYDGELDVYNYGVLPDVVLRDPAITTIADSSGTPDAGQTDGRIENATNPIVITGGVSGALSTGSYFRVYDGSDKIFDGETAVSGQQVTLSQTGTSFTFTDSRSLGTTVLNSTNSTPAGANTTGDDTFVLTDARVLYTIELVDGETGIPSRISSRDITITGGNGMINAGDGDDLLLMTQTSAYINGFATDANGNNRLQGVESISLSPNPLASTSVTLSSGAVTAISFSGNAGTGLADGTYVITISNEVESPAVSGTGAVATVTVSGGSITGATVLSGGSGYSSTTQALFSEGISLNLTGQTEGFQIIGGGGTDTITGGGGNDTIYGMAGADTISLSAGGADRVVYPYADSQLGTDAFYDLVTGMVGGSDAVEASDWVNKDTNSSRLMYETAVLGANKALSSATELLVVSDSAVSASGDLTGSIATALGSAFNVAGLDGTAPSASTGGGTGSTSLFAVLSNEAGKWWVGRYVDSGNDDTVDGAEIEVFGQFATDAIVNSFWQSTVLAPQAVTFTLPADTGPTETAPAAYYTQNTTVTVTGLASGNRLYYSLDNGSNWTTGAVDASTFSLASNATYAAGHIQVRQVDASGNYSSLSSIASSSREVVTDNIAPNAPTSAPAFDINDDVGAGTAGDNVTTQTSALTFTGQVAEANAIVEYYSGGSLLGQTTADGSGNYSFDISRSPGSHTITVKASDKAGNMSAASPSTQLVVSYTEISGGRSLGTISDSNVQVNDTNFGGAETLPSNATIHVLRSLVGGLTSTASYSSLDGDGPNYRTPNTMITSAVGAIMIDDTFGFGGAVESDPNHVATAANLVISAGVFNNRSAFIGLDDSSSTNRPHAWYWSDTGDGFVQLGELTLIGIVDGATGGSFFNII